MTKQIILTRGLCAIVDDEDYEMLAQHTWNAKQCRKTCYAATHEPGSGKTVYMHQLLLPPRAGYLTDHRNRNGLDNRRVNLRYATRSQNVINSPRWGSSPFRGVCAVAKPPPRPLEEGQKRRGRPRAGIRWIARIQVDGCLKRLGYFLTAEDAARAYDLAARKLHGPFAVLNFPSSITDG